MKKHWFILLILLTASCLIYRAQYPTKKFDWIKKLKHFDGLDTIKEGQCVVYGSFVGNMGTELAKETYQEIQLKNIETGEIYAMIMKPEFYKGKYYIMMFHILPGNYSLTKYVHSKEKIFKRKMITEPIIKNHYEASDTLRNAQYTISIKENSLNFIGNWDFDALIPEFKNNKERFDPILKPTYIRINFDSANIALPY